jgi:DNA-binding NarL/FixJ family response regulator
MSHLEPFDLHESLCLLVEDQAEASSYLRATVELAFPGIRVVCHRSLREARGWLQSTSDLGRLRLALIDLGLPDGSGVELIAQIATHHPSVLNIVVTIFHEDSYLFEALAAGAFGYILKDEERAHMIDTLRRIERNEPPISPAIARRLLTHFQAARSPQERKVELTPREKETLTLLVRGLTISEAAKCMALSMQTVSGYVKLVYQKMHVSNRAEAVREAMRLQLV